MPVTFSPNYLLMERQDSVCATSFPAAGKIAQEEKLEMAGGPLRSRGVPAFLCRDGGPCPLGGTSLCSGVTCDLLLPG